MNKRTPSPNLAQVTLYKVPRPELPLDLFLDGNEGARPPASLIQGLVEDSPTLLRNYPSAKALEAQLAKRYNIAPEQVLLTAGADEALDRICRAILSPDREILLPVPTFEMIERYVRLTGAVLTEIPWAFGTPYPSKQVIRKISFKTYLIAMISPNNPTGAVASLEDLEKISAAAGHAWVMLDHAYVEFSDGDFTEKALALPNVLVLRTFSKAWGMAGLRVGYVMGPAEAISWLRLAGGPYPVSGLSMALASSWFEKGQGVMGEFVDRIRRERAQLETLCKELRAEVFSSQANFVFARFPDGGAVQMRLAEQGIAVRAFPGKAGLENCLRITCPGDEKNFERLQKALERTK